MELGFFTMPVHPPERAYRQTLKEDRDAFILADQLGFSEGYCGEHLTDKVENIPNSMMFIASLLDSTKQMKLGTAVANLPHSHPVIVASNAAMLDNMLEGRFILGIGAGILRSDAEALGLLDADRQAMFVEAIDQVLAIWAGDAPYDIKGKFWNISTAKTIWPEVGIGSIVKPYQNPHPPIIGTASDPDSRGLIALGKRGWGPASSNLLHVNCLSKHWSSYAQGAAEVGTVASRKIWRVARSIFVCKDSQTAKAYGGDDPKSPYRFYMKQLLTKLGKYKRLSAFKSHPEMRDDEVTLDYVLDNIVIRGSVNEVVEKLLAMHELVGDFGTLLYCGKDWTDVGLGRKSMELMAEKVMPAVNSAISRSAVTKESRD
ncbi:MAG TPA: LLM class flavin-dependent oxidoreductase [Xanthobacteraceae bacterium]|jgi:alkanesulfonate monooxygenase SsuD/methylene tetrahydromethanopterin reductase-like flavin-dependent oxidoreductase (luciferase family)